MPGATPAPTPSGPQAPPQPHSPSPVRPAQPPTSLAHPSGADLAAALAAGPVVLDGGLSTELERAGYDISGDLWSAVLLRDAPAAAVAAHRAFFAAGAQVATTASYQASFEGFAAAGADDDEVLRLLRLSVRLAREATDGEPGRWVAASVGPYGAMLAGGQEYTGEYARPGADGALDVGALRAWHRRRLEVLADAGADVLAVETIPAAVEAEALIAEVAALGVPAWISLTTVTGPDGTVRTRLGEDAAGVFALARGVPEVIAVGVNCTDPDGVTAAVRVAAAASGKPVVAYPNSGETWDGPARRWRGRPDVDPAAVTAWTAAGARLVGGCCRVGPTAIRQLAESAPGWPIGDSGSVSTR
jgi:homocysteine S-methyltransferase